MRVNATPDIAGNNHAVAELRAGLASAVAVAVAESGVPDHAPGDERDRWLEHDVVGQVTADAAPRVAEFLERAIAERLVRMRLYGDRPEELGRPEWLTDRQRRAG